MKPRSLFPKKHPRQTASVATLESYWTLTTDQLFARLHTTSNGLQQTDAVAKLPWGIPIDAAHRIDIYKDLTQYPLETTRFHPTFAYEMLWNLLAFALIIYLANRLADRLKPGAIFLPG